MTAHDQPPPDPALDLLARRLDALGRAEAAGAPAGLESRVLAGVGRVFEAAPIPMPRTAPLSRAPRLAAAAGLALFAGAAALVYTGVRSPIRAGAERAEAALAESRIEGMLALATEPADGFGDEVASIELWADALSAESGWPGSDLTDAEWWDAGWASEGAM